MSSIIARAAGVFAVLSLLFISLPAVAAADSANLIANPSLETLDTTGTTVGLPTGWAGNNFVDTGASITPTNPYATTTDAHTGKVAATVNVTAFSGAEEAKWNFATIAVNPGEYYTFSDWYKSSTTTSVFVYPNAGEPMWIGDAAPSPTSWNYFTGAFLVPAGVTSITVGQVVQGVGSLTTDDYSLIKSDTAPTFSHGIVTLTFDDGWQSFWDNASSSLLTNKIPATNYIISTPALTPDPTNCGATTDALYPDCYMTSTEVQQLQASGFDIGAHTRTHPDLVHDPITNPAITLSDEITGSRTDLQTLLGTTIAAPTGPDPVDTFAYPFGQYNRTIEQFVHDQGFVAARSVDQGFNFANSDRFALKMQQLRTADPSNPIDHTTDMTDIQNWVQQAIKDHTWLILMIHNVRDTSKGQSCSVIEDDNGKVLTPPFAVDSDCITLDFYNQVVAYLANPANVPAGTLENMHQVMTNELKADTYAPVVVLNGALATTTAAGSTFNDPGVFSVTDNADVTPIGSTTIVPTVDSFDGAATTTTALNTKISGTWVLKYKIADKAGNVGSTTRTVIVGVNTPPVVKDIATSTLKNIPAFITLTGTDVDGTPLTFATTSSPVNGTLSGSGANLVYTASTTDFIGTDSFTFKANDGIADSNIATVTITVAPAPSVVATNILATPGQSDATITWNTVTVSSSTVIYSTDTSYSASTSNAAITASHSVALTGLTPGTLYHYEVISTDAANNTATSSDNTFTTATPAGSGSPAPTQISSGGGGGGGGFSYYGNVQANSGAATTTTATVTLALNSNASQVWISNNASFAQGGFVALSSTMPWTLAPGAGLKTIFVRFGSGSSTVASAQTSIYLNDGSAPAPVVTTTGGVVLGAQTSATCYTFTKSLVVGSTGADVTALQNTLTTLGYYNGPVTGYLGALTSAGISKYQTSKGISTTGTVGPLTRAALNTCTTGSTAPTTAGTVLGASTGPTTFTQTLMLGSTGDQVTALQTKLTTLNDYHGPIIGTFGPMTQAAVKEFQVNNNISATGTVGPLTRAALNAQ